MITIYGKQNCPQCTMAKQLCVMKGIKFEYQELGVHFQREEFIQKLQDEYGITPSSMPQIVDVDGYVGSFKELQRKLAA